MDVCSDVPAHSMNVRTLTFLLALHVALLNGLQLAQCQRAWRRIVIVAPALGTFKCTMLPKKPS